MNIFKSMELMEKYANCPKCGNDKIGNGQGGLILEENTLRRFCKCGWDITVDENGNKLEIESCKSCSFYGDHYYCVKEYYCNYHETYIEDLKICKSYKRSN